MYMGQPHEEYPLLYTMLFCAYGLASSLLGVSTSVTAMMLKYVSIFFIVLYLRFTMFDLGVMSFIQKE